MHIKNISFVGFKNYDQLDLEFSPKINCFIGPNGVGKTNLLDGVFYLSMCKSYLNPIDSQNIKYDQDFFVIQGDFFKADKTDQIYCGLKRGKKKQFKRNKKEYSKLADHIGQFPIVIISPLDSNLILGGSDERRKYMNSVISQYDQDYLNHVISYNHALAQRNQLLKNFIKNGQFDSISLEIWDEQLIQYGNFIYNKRLEFINELIPIFQKYYDYISGGKETVELKYLSHLVEGNFKDLLHSSLTKDRMVQHTTTGIHKDDFVLNLNGHPIKKSGSQGQQKTYLTSLKLAQFDFIKNINGFKPILLLDDIFDKFDRQRVHQIIRLVADENFGQIFITDTNQDRLEKILNEESIRFSLFRIESNGNLDVKQILNDISDEEE